MIHWQGYIGCIIGMILGVGITMLFQKLWNWMFK